MTAATKILSIGEIHSLPFGRFMLMDAALR